MSKSILCAAALGAVASAASAAPVTYVYADTLASGAGNITAGDDIEYAFTFEDGGQGTANRTFGAADLIGASLRIADIVRMTLDASALPFGAFVDEASLTTDATGAVATFDFALGQVIDPNLAAVMPGDVLNQYGAGGGTGAQSDPDCGVTVVCNDPIMLPVYEMAFDLDAGSTEVFSYTEIAMPLMASTFTGPSMPGVAALAAAPTAAGFAVAPVPLPGAGLLLLGGLGALAARRRAA